MIGPYVPFWRMPGGDDGHTPGGQALVPGETYTSKYYNPVTDRDESRVIPPARMRRLFAKSMGYPVKDVRVLKSERTKASPYYGEPEYHILFPPLTTTGV